MALWERLLSALFGFAWCFAAIALRAPALYTCTAIFFLLAIYQPPESH